MNNSWKWGFVFFVSGVISLVIALIVTEIKCTPLDSSEKWDSLVYVTKHYDTIKFKWYNPGKNIKVIINNDSIYLIMKP